MSKEPSYIRCMKPNDAKQAGRTLVATPLFLCSECWLPLSGAQGGAPAEKSRTVLSLCWSCLWGGGGSTSSQDSEWELWSWAEQGHVQREEVNLGDFLLMTFILPPVCREHPRGKLWGTTDKCLLKGGEGRRQRGVGLAR